MTSETIIVTYFALQSIVLNYYNNILANYNIDFTYRTNEILEQESQHF